MKQQTLLKTIDTDEFLDMSVSARELYFQLCARADEGEVRNMKSIMRMLNAKDDDLELLISKAFIDHSGMSDDGCYIIITEEE